MTITVWKEYMFPRRKLLHGDQIWWTEIHAGAARAYQGDQVPTTNCVGPDMREATNSYLYSIQHDMWSETLI